MARVVVAGGGLAGLAAAWRLQQAGHRVQVLEAEPEPGGRMRSERHGGFLLDRGAQFVSSAYRNLHGLLDALGLSGDVRPFRKAANAVLRDGRLHPADAGSALDLLRSPLLSLGARLRLARLPLEVARHRRRLDPWAPERAAEIDREDMATWMRRTIGDEAFEYLVAPAFSSTFDSDPEHLSAVFALTAIRFTSRDFRLESLEGGVGRLTRTLAATLDVRTGARVVSVETGSDGARIRFRSDGGGPGDGGQPGDGGEQVALADAAVVALPGTRVQPVCPKLTPAESAFFQQVRYVRGMIVFLMLPRAPETLPWYGVAFPRPEGLDLYGLAVDHWKPGQAPPGTGLVNCALTQTAAERLWNADDAAVSDCALASLARTPIGRLAPERTVVHRWDPMLPQFHAGYTRALADFHARTQRSPRLAFAGDYLVGPYTEGACTSGLRAAEQILAQLR